MLLRRTPPLAIAILALACEPSVPYNPATAPASVDYAGFDPTASPLPVLPLPNQLALTEPAIVTQNSTQAAVLRAFVAAGGFPNDQEVPITIPFVRYNIDPKTGVVTQTPPVLDLSSTNGNNLLILSTSSQGASGAVAYDPPKAGDYDSNTGILTLHKTPPCALVSPSTCTTGGKLTRRWDPGTYVVAVRGGPSGVQVTSSTAGLKPQATMYLLLSCTPTCPNGKGFLDPLNQGLIAGNNRGEKATNAALLEQLRIGYQGPFAAVDASGKFTHAEIATLSVFKIADVHAHVETDPGAGLMPIPSDFLLDANHNLIPAAQGAFGPAGPGLATLDGFSTTGPIIAQFSTAIDNSTIKDNVYIYELGATGPTRLKEANEGAGAGYLAQPPGTFQTIGAATVTTALVAQPGINIPGTPLVLPPLKENTEYAVVITSGVKDFVGSSPIVRSTLGTLLMLDPALPLTSNGQSLVAGVAASDAAGLQLLRLVLHGVVLPKLTADKGISRDQVVMAYTFKTQSITGKDVYSTGPNKNSVSGAIQIAQGVPNTVAPLVCAAAGVDCSKVVPSSTTTSTTGAAIAAVFDKYGVDPAVPRSNIGAIIETQIYTFNMLDPDTGAF